MTKHMTPEIYPTVPPTRPEPTEEQSLKATIAYHKRELVKFALEGNGDELRVSVNNIHVLEIRLAQMRVKALQEQAGRWGQTQLGRLTD